jgi:HSP20 family molecular chaperone IbpA
VYKSLSLVGGLPSFYSEPKHSASFDPSLNPTTAITAMSTFDLMLREMRPLFRLLDEPFARPFAPFAALPSARHAVARPRFQPLATPAVQLAEEDGAYVVEAELPGVRKEDVKVSVGDAGRSLTIAGSRTSRVARTEESAPRAQAQAEGLSSSSNVMNATANAPRVDSAVTNANAEGTAPMTATSLQSSESTSNAVTTADTQAPPRTPTPAVSTSSFSFSRTIWLPQSVDAAAVSAKLADGLLTVSVPKANVAQVTEVPVL